MSYTSFSEGADKALLQGLLTDYLSKLQGVKRERKYNKVRRSMEDRVQHIERFNFT